MQKRYALLLKVLKHFQNAGILDEIILVGSWCMYFYKNYFSTEKYNPSIRTKDIDFLIPLPIKFKKKIDIVEMLKPEGFIVTFSNSGYMRLEHPEIMIDFLIPEKGRGTDKPYPLPHLGVNAQALRFLDFLVQNDITLKSDNLSIRIPHPAAFGLHKLIISKRRKTEEKFLKEQREAITVLNTLIDKGETNKIKAMFDAMPLKWRKKILQILKESGNKEIMDILM
ncbi:MAG: GSU2403 family nucleotidyltransferase fold protein [Nitrospinota bacterium]|jgi:hypothetical protein